MSVQKLNKTFTAGQILRTTEMQAIVDKLDEMVDWANNLNVTGGGMNMVFDETLQKMKVTLDDGEYVDSTWVKIEKPNAPTIAITSAVLVSGSKSFAITNNTSGATVYYALYNSSTSTYAAYTQGTSITIASGYSNTKSNGTVTQKVKVKATKNGVDSDEVEYTLTITPQCAAPTITIVRNNNNNIYSTSASITIAKSASLNSTTEYKVGDGDWVTITGDSVTLSTTSSQSAGYVQARVTCTGYTGNSASSSAFTLNTAKMYYGGTSADITTLAGLQALAQLEANTLPQKLQYDGYIRAVFAYPKTLGLLTAIYDGSGVTDYFNNFTQTEVADYYVYTLNNAAQHDAFYYQFKK